MKIVFKFYYNSIIDYCSCTFLSSQIKQKYPKASQHDVSYFVRFFDKEKKGMIHFNTLMEFMESITNSDQIPDLIGICKNIADNLSHKMDKTIEEYFTVANIKENEEISVSEFFDKVGKPFDLKRKEAYFLYYKAKSNNEKERLTGGDIKTILEGKLFDEFKIICAPENISHDLTEGIVKLYDIIFTESGNIAEELLFKLFNIPKGDNNKDKLITKAEFSEGLNKLSLHFTGKQIADIIEFAHANKSESISLLEFTESVKTLRKQITFKYNKILKNESIQIKKEEKKEDLTFMNIKENIRILKENTNLSKYCNDLDSLSNLIDFPYDSFKFDPNKHFMKNDEEDISKKKFTILSSKKAALFVYYASFNKV